MSDHFGTYCNYSTQGQDATHPASCLCLWCWHHLCHHHYAFCIHVLLLHSAAFLLFCSLIATSAVFCHFHHLIATATELHDYLQSHCAVSPLINLEMQHGGRSAQIRWKEFNYFSSLWWEGKRDLLESTKMDFMRLRMNYSKRCSRWRFPQRVSIDPDLSRSVTIS